MAAIAPSLIHTYEARAATDHLAARRTTARAIDSTFVTNVPLGAAFWVTNDRGDLVLMIFHPRTLLEAMQRTSGATVDGIWGSQTFQRLAQYSGVRSAVAHYTSDTEVRAVLEAALAKMVVAATPNADFTTGLRAVIPARASLPSVDVANGNRTIALGRIASTPSTQQWWYWSGANGPFNPTTAPTTSTTSSAPAPALPAPPAPPVTRTEPRPPSTVRPDDPGPTPAPPVAPADQAVLNRGVGTQPAQGLARIFVSAKGPDNMTFHAWTDSPPARIVSQDTSGNHSRVLADVPAGEGFFTFTTTTPAGQQTVRFNATAPAGQQTNFILAVDVAGNVSVTRQWVSAIGGDGAPTRPESVPDINANNPNVLAPPQSGTSSRGMSTGAKWGLGALVATAIGIGVGVAITRKPSRHSSSREYGMRETRV